MSTTLASQVKSERQEAESDRTKYRKLALEIKHTHLCKLNWSNKRLLEIVATS